MTLKCREKARRVIRDNLGFSFVKLEAIIELKLEFYSSIHFNCSELLRVPAKLYPIKAAVTSSRPQIREQMSGPEIS